MNKWKKLYSCVLAVCLIGTLVLANQSFGVFAEKTEEEATTEQGKTTVESTEGKIEAKKSNDENKQETSVKKDILKKIQKSEKQETKIGILSANDGIEVQTDTISELIDADEILLKWKAIGTGTTSITIGGISYNVSDNNTYQKAYEAVYNAMEKAATIVSSNGAMKEINAQKITTDTIWKISGDVSMTGTVTVENSGRLIILGEGKIQRTEISSNSSSIVLNGKLCLQGSVVFDGGNEKCDARFLKAVKDSNTESKPKIYLTDDFKIQNIVLNNNNGAGIYADKADIYMSGGTIGSDDISFEWDDNQITKYGGETEIYLEKRENKNEYPYLKSITSKSGCIANANKDDVVTYGAGIYLSSSSFNMSGGNILGNTLYGMSTSGTKNNKTCHGAGAYFGGCEVNITGGKISGNQSNTTNEAKNCYDQYAGAIQLDGNGKCQLSNVEIAYNYAQRWVGAIDISQQCQLIMDTGTVIKYNYAQSNSGAVAVDGTYTQMTMNSGKIIHNYSGGLGGGIRCLGTLTMNNGEIAYNKSKGNAAGLSVQSDQIRTGKAILNGGDIHHNKSDSNGGGMGIVTGYEKQTSGLTLNGTGVYANEAEKDGGGFYIDARNGTVNVELAKGKIYNNQAKNGGGVYINQANECIATLKMTSDEMLVEKNSASENGGGIYMYHNTTTGNNNNGNTGSIAAIIQKGHIRQNFATQDGGGAYLASGMLEISGGVFENNTSVNGGGAYISDGEVRMFGGNITNNKAQQNGGGFYVSSNEKPADVLIRSGKLTNNTAGNSTTDDQGNGGAIAVVSHNTTNADHVIIGLRHKHKDLDLATRKFTPFDYQDDKDNNNSHNHESCPEITGNQASGNGGGIYMNSSQSILDIYCLLENNNVATKDPIGASIMSEGGNVNIGDKGENGSGNNTENAVGNISIKSSMLVKGGNVQIYGNTDNPKFEDKILVNIQKNAGSFNDYRFTKVSGDTNYKIEYFENFEDSGAFTSIQYKADDDIVAMGNMYTHEGYKIVGWNTLKNGTETTGTMYKIGTSIATKDDHSAWNEKQDTEALRLYAIWKKISYTVKYDPNANNYSGAMNLQKFQYGEAQELTPNKYKVRGKRFLEWNTEPDGSGKTYKENYSESKMINADGETVTLYAQWVDCTHKGGEHPGQLSYKADEDRHTITETCDCEGHTAIIQISAADVYYDEKAHPASLSKPADFLAGDPTIVYQYKETADGTYGDMPDNTTEPTQVGYYKATITIDGRSTSVEYEIKSPAEAATIDVAATQGQYFHNFTKIRSCTVAGDDAFTVQYDVQGLNKASENSGEKAYTTAPVLTLNQQLPEATTIIMQTEGSYWYRNNPKETEIQLTSFRKMGKSDESFAYNTSNIKDAQKYRFIINFSNVAKANQLSENTSLEIGLKYKYAASTEGGTSTSTDKEEKAQISIGKAFSFTAVPSTGNTVTITAPSNITDTKWARKNLVWKITTSDSNKKLPSDAKLTLSATVNGQVKTAIYSQNEKGEFIIPFSWAGNQDFTFALSSEQEAQSGQSYKLTAALCVGSKNNNDQQPEAIEDSMQKASSELTLTVPATTKPALKISGTRQRVFTKNENLKVDINYRNVGNCSIKAIIQKKGSNEYGGNYMDQTIEKQGEHSFGLQATDDAGSYRLLITVSTTTGQKLLEVPYYFIIQ